MNKTGKLRLIGENLLLFAILFGAVSFNKEVLRPVWSHVPLLDALTGCVPNFLAASIIALGVVNAVRVREPRHGRPIVYAASFLVFVILAVEELKPMWGASTYYDPLDIIASGAGSIVAVVVYELLRLRRIRRGRG